MVSRFKEDFIDFAKHFAIEEKNGSILDVDNRTDVDEKVSKNYTITKNSMAMMELTTFCASAMLVCGVFSNLIAIGVFSMQTFTRMSFKVSMKILCSLNIIVLFLGMIRHHMFILDFRRNVEPDNRRYVCTYMLWYILVFDHTLAVSLILILYNRIKAQRTPDACIKSLDAIRAPVLTNSIILLLCTVPVSTYIIHLDENTVKYNRTECTFAYMLPFEYMSSTDSVVSNLPIFEDVTMVCMLLILGMEVMLKQRRMNRKSQRSSSILSIAENRQSSPLSEQIEILKIPRYSQSLKSELTPGESHDIHESLMSMNDEYVDLDERDISLTYMAAVVVLAFLFLGSPRRLVRATLVQEYIPLARTLMESFTVLSLLDIMFYAYLSSAFILFCASSRIFREEACCMLFDVDFTFVTEEMPMQTSSQQYVPIRRRKMTMAVKRSTWSDVRGATAEVAGAGFFNPDILRAHSPVTPNAIIENFELTQEELKLTSESYVKKDLSENTSSIHALELTPGQADEPDGAKAPDTFKASGDGSEPQSVSKKDSGLASQAK